MVMENVSLKQRNADVLTVGQGKFGNYYLLNLVILYHAHQTVQTMEYAKEEFVFVKMDSLE